jgi:AcrR family transcriptional regulator
MNTKNNKRRRESVEKIEKAYIELLQEKERKNISISLICENAGVNRSTFYANFIDLYDLETSIKEKLLAKFCEVYNDKIKMRGEFSDFIKLFYHIKDNKALYKAYFKFGEGFTVNDMRYDIGEATKYFNNEFIDYHIEFFYNGLNAVIKKWLEGDCKESPEEIENIIKTEYQGRKL